MCSIRGPIIALPLERLRRWVAAPFIISLATGCVHAPPGGPARDANREVPTAFSGLRDTRSSGLIRWDDFFDDPHLSALVETALQNNQELNLNIQEALVANAEIMARRGEYLPKLGFGIGAGVEHVGAFTSQGKADELTGVDRTLQAYEFGLYSSWEIDVWGRLHNLADAASSRYLASLEGRNFVVTRLIAEIASLYYELMSLDLQLRVVSTSVGLQENALELVTAQYEAGRTTALAPTRFEAELRSMQSSQFDIQQRITETENRLNFLVGRFPQPVERSTGNFLDLQPPAIGVGVPSELLANRPDIRQAELELAAAALDVQAARKAFYPAIGIDARIGYQSFDARRLLDTPDSLLFGILGQAMMPLLNRQGLTADYYSANARQVSAVLQYERAVLTAFIEVANRVSLIENLRLSYDRKRQQVEQLAQSIEISTDLFNSGRADYLEVLTTRRESLQAQLELTETKQRQMVATVTLYQALGGGWRQTAFDPATTSAPDEEPQK